MLGLITASSDPERIDAFAATYLRHYVGTMVELSNPFAGVDTMLDAIAGRGLPIAVLTNKTEANAKRICDGRLGPRRFAAIVGAVPGRPTKPDPAGARLLASQLGVDPLACWLVGDSHVDIDTARAANMSAVGVRWGITESLAAKLTHADVVLDRTEQLVALIDAAVC
jgi:phosphoglycolate phosphatase